MLTLNAFKIIGISVRTINKGNQSAKDIGKLWEQFYANKIFDKVPNKLSDSIYSIYTDYKSDFTDEYTTLLGFQVKNLEKIPEGLIGREFPTNTFTKFVAKGQMPKAIIDTWNDIWKKDKELKRTYTYDFEVYSDKSQKGKDSEVELFLATKG